MMSFMDVMDGSFRPNNVTKLALLLGSMLVLMGSAAVAPSLNSIEVEFGASAFLVSLIVSLPSLVVAVMGFPMGYLADRIGSASVFVVSLAIFLFSGLAGYFCTDIYTMLATRVFLGIGIAGLGTTATALLGIYYDGDERMRVMAIQSAFMGFGGVVLEAIGGIMADVAWNTPFLVYLIAAPILIAGLLYVRNVPLNQQMPDEAEALGKGRKVQMAFLYACIFMLMFIMFLVPANMSNILTPMDKSMTICGFVIALMGLVQTIVSLIYSRMKHLPKYTHLLVLAFVLQGIAALLIATNSFYTIVVGVAVLGVGMGIGMPTIVNNLSRMSPASAQGKTMGLYSVFMNLGTSVSGMVIAAVATAQGYPFAMTASAVMILLFAILTVVFGRVYVKNTAAA